MGETDVAEQVLGTPERSLALWTDAHETGKTGTTFVTATHPKANVLVFAMPGNPVALLFVPQLLVRPQSDLLFYSPNASSRHGRRLCGRVHSPDSAGRAGPPCSKPLAHDIQLDAGTTRILHRVTPKWQTDGNVYQATSTGKCTKRSSRWRVCVDA
jgi:hypothetical protein